MPKKYTYVFSMSLFDGKISRTVDYFLESDTLITTQEQLRAVKDEVRNIYGVQVSWNNHTLISSPETREKPREGYTFRYFVSYFLVSDEGVSCENRLINLKDSRLDGEVIKGVEIALAAQVGLDESCVTIIFYDFKGEFPIEEESV
jgi:hypothetical protein